MRYILLSLIVAAQLACKKEPASAPPAVPTPAAHLDPRNAAATLDAARSAAQKLEAAEAKQSEQLDLIQAK
jgi:hypothetical protein